MFEPNLGIYTCAGQKFHSKVQACLHSQLVNQPVEWDFHNEVFTRFAWNQEPNLSLDQLYDARARELREKYDYLLLSYSGGSDSHNMVQAFVRQGLHIDEIITNHITQATCNNLIIDVNERSAWNFNAEHQLQAIPRLRELHDLLPKTKFTVIDMSDIVLDSLQTFDDVHWVLGRTLHLSVGQTFRYNLFMLEEIKKKFDRGQQVAIVVGVDKPKTKIDSHGMFKIVFADGVTNITSVNEFNDDYPNVRIELFYWSDTTCALVAKQAHTILRWIVQDQKRISVWQQAGADMRHRAIIEPILRELLYTTWKKDWFQTKKATNALTPEYDRWFHANPAFDRQQLLWRRGIDYLAKIIPDFISKDSQGCITGIRGFYHEFEIGPIKPE